LRTSASRDISGSSHGKDPISFPIEVVEHAARLGLVLASASLASALMIVNALHSDAAQPMSPEP